MTAETVSTADQAPIARPERKMFRRRFQTTLPPADQMARQSRLARSAWTLLGNRDAVIAFLNTHDDSLGGRPIDLALKSEEHLGEVERHMAAYGRQSAERVIS